MVIKKIMRQMLCYLGVGIVATLIEWVIFYVLTTKLNFHYALATIFAFSISTFANWLLGRLFIFKKSDKSVLQEFFYIYSASIIGLGLNLVIMFILIEKLACIEMLAKMLATGIVFFWNFGVRKIFIYKSNK